jgi:large subunit ribosomal protein L25
MGGVLSQPTHELHISVLPTAIPEEITVDVSALDIGGSLRLVDIPPVEGVTFLDDPEGTALATVSAPISEEELEAPAAEGEEEAEAAAQEGAEAEGDGGEAEGEAPAEDSSGDE